MNRLWVRLSLAFALVVMVVFPVIGISMRISNQLVADEEPMPPEVAAYFRERGQESSPLANVTAVLVAVGVVAIAAGTWMSRTLTAPLGELEKAAQAIGKRDLSQRVTVQGSAEIQAVSVGFNEMVEQLDQAEQLRRNLLADVAHELRNPLHVLRGNLQAILDEVFPMTPEEIARLLDQTRHLTRMVDDLHELAQAEAKQLTLNRGPVDAASLVKEVGSVFNSQAAEKQISLRVELLGAMPTVQADAARLRQAVINLLSNALRHTPSGGQVLVTVHQEGDTLQIGVSDSGAGIDPAQLPRVFDRFYRTDSGRSRDRGGTGLGLAITKAIIEAHDGNVTAESEGKGQGSRFVITLPLA